MFSINKPKMSVVYETVVLGFGGDVELSKDYDCYDFIERCDGSSCETCPFDAVNFITLVKAAMPEGAVLTKGGKRVD